MEMRDLIVITGMLASALASYVAAMTSTRLKLQHLQDVKADRDELTRLVTDLKDGLHLLERKITEMDTKISLLLLAKNPQDLSVRSVE
ncbi:MAG: hypothetical protein NTW14_12560 [bacterium]|nr:hypothetical protein [bacterium]